MARQPDDESMRRLATQITSGGLKRDDAREVRRQEAGPRVVPETKPYAFRYVAPQKEFSLEVKFRRAGVSLAEVTAALHVALQAVEAESIEQESREVETDPPSDLETLSLLETAADADETPA
jgi:hypothetical protein